MGSYVNALGAPLLAVFSVLLLAGPANANISVNDPEEDVDVDIAVARTTLLASPSRVRVYARAYERMRWLHPDGVSLVFYFDSRGGPATDRWLGIGSLNGGTVCTLGRMTTSTLDVNVPHVKTSRDTATCTVKTKKLAGDSRPIRWFLSAHHLLTSTVTDYVPDEGWVPHI
jgi:hypothetical protein